ncbi:MAG: preprotein translocase subunit TatC [Phycisphaerales bacterium]|nr:preprotein translocase subunit TatC [Phycisphaerales bacterium]
MTDSSIMPLGAHLDELRRRLVFALIAFIPVFFVAFAYGVPILELMLRPVILSLREAGQSAQLQATGPLETFSTVIKVAFIATLIVVGPWALLQLWLFVAPGLFAHERRFAYLLVPMSFVLAIGGVAFLFKVLLPIMLAFLITFGGNVREPGLRTAPVPEGVTLPGVPVLAADPENPGIGAMWVNSTLNAIRLCQGKTDDGMPIIKQVALTRSTQIAQQYRVSEYVGLLLSMSLAFSVAFQMPVVVMMLGWAGIIEPATLRRFRKQALIVCAALGAVLTPTADPLTMLLLAGPLYGLYEMGLLMLRLLPASRVSRGFDIFSRRKPTPDDTEGP